MSKNLEYSIIDTHAHFGIEKNKEIERIVGKQNMRGQILLEDMRILKSSVGYQESLLDENNSLDAYVSVMEKNGISSAWIHQLSFENELGYEILSNEEIANAKLKYPGKFKGFASVNPNESDAVKKIDYAINDLKLDGFKLNPNDYGGFWINDKKILYPIFEKCCEKNLPISIHTGITPGRLFRMKYNYPLLVDDVAVDFPELTIIVEHMGFPWNDLCNSMVQRHPNMYVTITAVANVMIHNNPNQFLIQLAKMISILGSEKILWGSDWTATPNLDEVLSFLKNIKLPFIMQKKMGLKKITDQDIKNILHDNALRVLK